MHYAVESRRKAAVETLLHHGAEVDAVFDGGVTPLHLAARDGLYSITVLLLAFGAKAHRNDAAVAGHTHVGDEMLRRKLGNGVHINHNPLASDAMGSHASLLSASSSPSSGGSLPSLSPPTKAGKHEMGVNTSPGTTAASAYSRVIRSPLQWSVATGCLEVTALLISDSGYTYERFPPHDMYSGKTCLHVATILGYVEIVEALLRAGADVDGKDDSGKKAYQYCEDSVHPRSDEILRVLLSYASTRVVSSGGKLDSKSSKLMLIVGAMLGYIDIGTDIAAIYMMFQISSDVYNHSNASWAILGIVSLCMPHVSHCVLQIGRGHFASAVRSIVGIELAYAAMESLRTNTRNSTYATMKYLTIAFQSIPQVRTNEDKKMKNKGQNHK